MKSTEFKAKTIFDWPGSYVLCWILRRGEGVPGLNANSDTHDRVLVYIGASEAPVDSITNLEGEAPDDPELFTRVDLCARRKWANARFGLRDRCGLTQAFCRQLGAIPIPRNAPGGCEAGCSSHLLMLPVRWWDAALQLGRAPYFIPTSATRGSLLCQAPLLEASCYERRGIGQQVLVSWKWPRGVRYRRIDSWIRRAAPSKLLALALAEMMSEEFDELYRQEFDASVLEELKVLLHEPPLTLVDAGGPNRSTHRHSLLHWVRESFVGVPRRAAQTVERRNPAVERN